MTDLTPETLAEHDHTGPDWRCEACKPLADVLRGRMRWPSLHWGSLHDDAFPSLARAVYESGWYAEMADALAAEKAAREEAERYAALQTETLRTSEALVKRHAAAEAEQRLRADKAVQERDEAQARAWDEGWQAGWWDDTTAVPGTAQNPRIGRTEKWLSRTARTRLCASPTSDASTPALTLLTAHCRMRKRSRRLPRPQWLPRLAWLRWKPTSRT